MNAFCGSAWTNTPQMKNLLTLSDLTKKEGINLEYMALKGYIKGEEKNLYQEVKKSNGSLQPLAGREFKQLAPHPRLKSK
jgi:hypothetical protein